MSTQQESEWLSIREAGRQLKVSRTTIHRWLKQGRLRAYHIGPKAVRIRRPDIERVIAPMRRAGAEVDPMNEARPASVQTAVRPLTDEEKAQQRAAFEASQALVERMKARRGGVPAAESWPLLRQAREGRERRQA